MTIKSITIETDDIEVDGLRLHMARSVHNHGNEITLLLFNGIGANLELFMPLMNKLKNTQCLIFDMPGIGGSEPSTFPMRFKQLAELSAHLLDKLSLDKVDVLGVSWGGALAQEFCFQFPERCRRLILAATSPGSIMIPGKLSVLLKLTNPKRYITPEYLRDNAPDIYGGLFREQPELTDMYAKKLKSPNSKRGYYWQLYAGLGWTSIHWLHKLDQPTLILAGNDDPIIPIVNAQIMQHRIPNSQLIELNCGHLFLFTMVDQATALITDFLLDDRSDTESVNVE